MGNQGHSQDGTRRINELIAAGVIGPVREVHVWTDRPQRYWAQGIPRPQSGMPTPPAQATQAAQQQQWESPLPLAKIPAAPRWGVRTVDNAILKAMAENP